MISNWRFCHLALPVFCERILTPLSCLCPRASRQRDPSEKLPPNMLFPSSLLCSSGPRSLLLTVGFVPDTSCLSSHPSLQSQNHTCLNGNGSRWKALVNVSEHSLGIPIEMSRNQVHEEDCRGAHLSMVSSCKN